MHAPIAFNLVELFCLIIPFEWWMPKRKYERLNNYVMGVIYSPLLLVTSWLETRQAHQVIAARSRDDASDDIVHEWEEMGVDGAAPDFEADGWAKKVEETKPNVETDAAVLEVRELKKQVTQLMKLVEKIQENGSKS